MLSWLLLLRKGWLVPLQFIAGQKALPPVLLEGQELAQSDSTRRIDSRVALQVAELSHCQPLILPQPWLFCLAS